MSIDIVEQIKNEKRWYFRATLIEFYHLAQRQEFGNRRGKGWIMKDTAKALGISVGAVCEACNLSQFFKNRNDAETFTRESALEEMKK